MGSLGRRTVRSRFTGVLTAGVVATGSAMFVLLGALTAGAQSATETPTPHFCAALAPDGWEVVESASNRSESGLLCNYKVTRTIQGRQYVSGVAITIEYFCNPSDGTAAFKGKTGKRETELPGRTANRLVTQEGPKARNPKNPQKDGVFSGFFPGITFGLQEKEWLLFKPPQGVATLVVLTNEKGAVVEQQRFGVADAELVAGDLAPAYKPGCISGLALPPGGSKKKAPPAGKKGGSKIPGLIAVGGLGGTVILVIGRRRFRPKFKPRGKTAKGPNVWDPTIDDQRKAWNEGQKIWDPETKTYRPWVPGDLEEIPEFEPPLVTTLPRDRVPSQCLSIYDELTKSQEELSWLESAIKESEAKVASLELLFLQNRARASIQISIEIGQGVATITGGLTSAAKNVLVTNRAGLGGAIRSATSGETLEELMMRRRALASLEGDTALRNAKQMHEYWSNKLRTAEADLPKAIRARAALDEAGKLESARGSAITKMANFRDPVLKRISDLEGQIEWLHQQAHRTGIPFREQMAEIDVQMRRVEGTLGAKGPIDPRRAAAIEKLAERKAGLQSQMAEQFNDTMADNASKIHALEAQIAAERATLVPTNDGWTDMSKAWEQSRIDKGKAFGKLDKLENVTEADVGRLRILQSKAFDELSLATAMAHHNVAAQLAGIDSEIAEIKAALAKMAASQAQPALPVRVVQTVLGPVTIIWQKLFGAGDTPQEMIDILLKNKEAVLVERANLIKTKSTYDDLKTAAIPAITAKLQSCLETYTPLPMPVPKLDGAQQ